MSGLTDLGAVSRAENNSHTAVLGPEKMQQCSRDDLVPSSDSKYRTNKYC